MIWLLLACARAPVPQALADHAQLLEDFQVLHEAVYGVYALGPDRDAVHGLLSQAFHGDALTSEYIEHYTTMVRMEHEETSIDIRKVDYEAVDVLDASGALVRVDVAWSVGGVVTHRGHKHPRTNAYQAVYTLADVDGSPRIVSTRMRNLERVRRASVDDVWDLEDMPSGGGGFMDLSDLIDAGVVEVPDGAPSGE